jgi:hypothetical protein
MFQPRIVDVNCTPMAALMELAGAGTRTLPVHLADDVKSQGSFLRLYTVDI